MTGKHSLWHRQWRVDPGACMVTHTSGLTLKVVRAQDDDATFFEPANIEEWQSKMLQTMTLPNLVSLAMRLIQEAAKVHERERGLPAVLAKLDAARPITEMTAPPRVRYRGPRR